MGYVEASMPKKQLYSSSGFDTTAACDGRTDRQTDRQMDGHMMTAYTMLA